MKILEKWKIIFPKRLTFFSDCRIHISTAMLIKENPP
uniref:Uncharacterized protein n=1 Tax=Myoviridae sp. ctOAa14 TaxID=2826646 RepID=A0A8S5MRR6_9CAUD|nr:MAG TPA: hypothetical protein [Myoviridae sp. ctOAa14]